MAALAGWLLLILPSPTHAETLFSLTFTELNSEFNYPTITLTNLSTDLEEIRFFSISVGEAGYYFDGVWDTPENVASEIVTGATLVTGDRQVIFSNNSTTVLEWRFSDFLTRRISLVPKRYRPGLRRKRPRNLDQQPRLRQFGNFAGVRDSDG